VQVFVHHALAVFIQAVDPEDILCQVDADQGNLTHGVGLLCKVLAFTYAYPFCAGEAIPSLTLEQQRLIMQESFCVGLDRKRTFRTTAYQSAQLLQYIALVY
jgi:hypothetical protein